MVIYMTNQIYTIQELKKELKENNLKLRVYSYGEGKVATIMDLQGNELPTCTPTIFRSETSLNKWSKAEEIYRKYKRKLIDENGYKVVLA
jgi:ABC-type branched-subunit amino acid transport system substrate-binding protein